MTRSVESVTPTELCEALDKAGQYFEKRYANEIAILPEAPSEDDLHDTAKGLAHSIAMRRGWDTTPSAAKPGAVAKGLIAFYSQYEKTPTTTAVGALYRDTIQEMFKILDVPFEKPAVRAR